MANVIEFTIKGVDSFSRVTDKFSSTLIGAGKSVIKFTAIVGGLATVAALPILNTSRAFEKMEASLKTVTGSAENAAKAMAGIKDFAQTTPFQVKEITQAFIKLTSLGLTPSEEALRSYGNTAAAMGKSLNQFIEAVADASTNEFERLKEFGITARQEGDKVAFTFQGVTTTIKKNSEDISRYLQAIGNNQFAGATAVQMDTLDGKLSNLSDSFDALFDTIGKAGALEFAKKAVSDLTTFVKSLGNIAIRVSVVVGLSFNKIKKIIAESIGSGTAFKDMFKVAIVVLVALAKRFRSFGNAVVKVLVSAFRIAFQAVFEIGKFAFQRLFDFISGNDNAITLDGALDELQKNSQEARDNIVLDFIEMKSFIADSVTDSISGIADFISLTAEEINAKVFEIQETITGVQGALAESTKASAENINTIWGIVFENMRILQERQGTQTVETAAIMQKALQNLIAQTSDAIAGALVEGKSLAETMRNVMQNVIKQVISSLIQMAIQRTITSRVFGQAAKAETRTKALSLPGIAAAQGLASFSGAPWPINLGAPAFAAAMYGVGQGYATQALAGLGAGQFHDGGVVPRDGSYNLQGGEVVVPNNPSQDVVNALGDFSGGGSDRSISIGAIHILENATNADALISLSASEWKDIVEDKIIDALSSLDDEGIRPRSQERNI